MQIIISVLVTGALFAAYIVPTIVAMRRDHRQIPAIAAVNLLLGWTMVGWVAALAWSLTTDVWEQSVEEVNEQPTLNDELAQLFELKELGALTEEEFILAKVRLLQGRTASA